MGGGSCRDDMWPGPCAQRIVSDAGSAGPRRMCDARRSYCLWECVRTACLWECVRTAFGQLGAGRGAGRAFGQWPDRLGAGRSAAGGGSCGELDATDGNGSRCGGQRGCGVVTCRLGQRVPCAGGGRCGVYRGAGRGGQRRLAHRFQLSARPTAMCSATAGVPGDGSGAAKARTGRRPATPAAGVVIGCRHWCRPAWIPGGTTALASEF